MDIILPRLSLMNNLVFCTFSFVNSSTLICYKLGIFRVQLKQLLYICLLLLLILDNYSTTISLLKCIDVPTLHPKHSLLFFPCHKSNVFCPLVGKCATCSNSWSLISSTNFAPSDMLNEKPCLLSLSGQTISLKLKSPKTWTEHHSSRVTGQLGP